MALTVSSTTDGRSADWVVHVVDVEGIVTTIERRLPGVARPEIEAAVMDEALRFRDARVAQFLPILIERAALARVRPPTTRLREVTP